MTRIILASSSPQRKKLMKLLGVPFTVRPSGVAELMKIRTNVADLVMHNALIKAQDIASKVKEGIVIGSDTVVYLGGKKMILKPKSVKEAKRNLKLQFHRPQWVYSGVAVIDASTGKKKVLYDAFIRRRN
jgi:septum formation protein